MVAVSLPVTTLGATGLPVTRIGLGLAALGRPAYITLGRDRDLGADRDVDAMRRRSHQVLDAAYGAGVRYFDVARSYGRAEEFLASWLHERGVAPDAVTVGSKWGYRYTGEWRLDAPVQEVKDHSLDTFRRQEGETLALLGTYLRLYQVHSATLDSGILDDEGVLRALVDMSRGGVAVGLTVSGPGQSDTIRRALRVDVDGTNPFTSVQATWNVLEPSAGAALEEAHAAGWGVLVKEALANGRLVTPPDVTFAGKLTELASTHGAGTDQVALAAALVQPWADVVLSGAVTEAQLLSNLAALSISLTESEMASLGTLAEAPEAYWRHRSSLEWR